MYIETKTKEDRRGTKAKEAYGKQGLDPQSYLGGPIQGGVTDTVHLLIRLLRELGLSVYCTALTATEAEIKEAKEYGVEFIAPSPIPKFKSRGEIPNADWLYRHEDYFPNLKELANVRFVFGFGMINSDAAFKIEKDVFPRAAFYLINLYDKDLITPVIASCVIPELEVRRKNIPKESKAATSVFSVGSSIFEQYETMYRKPPKITHYRLTQMVDDEFFDIPSPRPVKKGTTLQILSLFQEDELENLKSDSAIVQAMNSVADLFYKDGKSPPKWKIFGVPKRGDSDLIKTLNPHSKLKVILRRMPSAEELNDELGQSHLVLVPPSSVHYVNLTLAAMCAGVPIIVPRDSQSHELIKGHLPDREERLVVDMNHADVLEKRIMEFLCNFQIALNQAEDIKKEMKNKVQQELEDINNVFLKVVQSDAQQKYKVALQRQSPLTKTKDGETSHNQDSHKISRNSKSQEREPGDIKVTVRVSEVVPEQGRTVNEVERGFYESDEVKEKTEEAGQSLDGQHDEIKVKGSGQGSISFTMSCQSLDALECLMRKYENGTLQDIMERKFLSDELLDKIGAFYLAIDVTIDYEEYFLCRQELIQKYGLASQDTQQKRDTDQAQDIETEETESSPTRVNKARYLLQSFRREGDTVTEAQIAMLDKLLKKKEDRRQIEHQRHVQESATGILPHNWNNKYIYYTSPIVLIL
ncbi:uncharacterized protein [Ptychodera flava]|uniref:uncharacterized protein n=1 Tax=Ptychodera flava TaxID=63121 RepID=UPI003969D0C6